MNARQALEAAQSDMVSALMQGGHDTAAPMLFKAASAATWRGWQAYRANAHASAARALQDAYPVIRQLVGDSAFEHMARAFWHAHPPERGDLGQWGDRLPSWMAQDQQLMPWPYLSDVARVEWAMHQAATAADASLELDSFGVLTDTALDPGECHLNIASGLTLIDGHWPAADIILTHQASSPDWSALAALMNSPSGSTSLVWRQHWQVRVMALCTADDVHLLRGLASGHPLGQTLDGLDQNFDFNAWLSRAVHMGWVVGARAPDAIPPSQP